MQRYIACLDENIEASYREAESGENGELVLFTDMAKLAKRCLEDINSSVSVVSDTKRDLLKIHLEQIVREP